MARNSRRIKKVPCSRLFTPERPALLERIILTYESGRDSACGGKQNLAIKVARVHFVTDAKITRDMFGG